MAPGLGDYRVLSAALLLSSEDISSRALSAFQNVSTLLSSSTKPFKHGRALGGKEWKFSIQEKEVFSLSGWEEYWGGYTFKGIAAGAVAVKGTVFRLTFPPRPVTSAV